MKNRNRYFLIGATYGIMLMFGFAENLKGMAIPPMRKEYNVNFSTIGTMVFCASLGYLFACLIGGSACEKYGKKRVLAAGYILLIFSMISMSFAFQFWMVCVLMLLMFAGMGLFEAGCNVLAGRIFKEKTALMMNLLHLFYGIGSIIGPWFAAIMLLKGFSWKQYYLFAAGIIVIFFIFMMSIKFPPEEAEEEHEGISLKQVLKDGTLWVLGIALGFCVTLELGTSNWLVNYLSVEYSMNESNTSFYMSLFYVTFAVGRLFGGFIVEKLGYLKSIITFLVVTLLLYIAAGILRINGAILISASGFFISVIFPTVMAIIVHEYKYGTGTVMGFIIAASAAVNMVFNWVIGKTNDIFGVYAGFNSFIIYGVASIVLFSLFGWMKRVKTKF